MATDGVTKILQTIFHNDTEPTNQVRGDGDPLDPARSIFGPNNPSSGSRRTRGLHFRHLISPDVNVVVNLCGA